MITSNSYNSEIFQLNEIVISVNQIDGPTAACKLVDFDAPREMR